MFLFYTNAPILYFIDKYFWNFVLDCKQVRQKMKVTNKQALWKREKTKGFQDV